MTEDTRKPYPPQCHIHERQMVYREGYWKCPEIDADGTPCYLAYSDEEARSWQDEILLKPSHQKNRS